MATTYREGQPAVQHEGDAPPPVAAPATDAAPAKAARRARPSRAVKTAAKQARKRTVGKHRK